VKAILLAGASPLVAALGVRLARANWPLAGIWDADHEQALTASLRVGCCAFPDAAEPLARAGFVLLGQERPDWLTPPPAAIVLVATWPGSREEAWLVPERPVLDAGEDLSGLRFKVGGPVQELVLAMGLTCSNQV
jgi:hypothetical protein